MDKKNIFRKEVLEQRLTSNLGPVLITLPIRLEYLSWLFLLVVFGLTLYLVFAKYSDTVLIPGFVDVEPGITQVFPLKPGVILKRLVKVGEEVKRGQTLMIIETGHAQFSKSQTSVLKKLKQLEQAMKQDIQEKKVKLHELRRLVTQHYLSKMEWITFKKGLHETQQQLAELSLRRMNLTLNRQYKIVAPIDAKVMEVTGSNGKIIQINESLIKLMPLNATWAVTLLAPISAIRFLKVNQAIELRYDAYPYLEYGTSPALIREVSPVLSIKNNATVPVQMKQPFYQVQTTLLAKTQKLYHGMTLQAVINTEARPLWRRLLHR